MKTKVYLISILILSIGISSLVGVAFGFLAGRGSLEEFAKTRNIKDIFNIKSERKQENKNLSEKTERQEGDVIVAVKKASPAVVSIIVTKDVVKYRNFKNNPFFGGFGFPFTPFDNNQNRENNIDEIEKQKVGGGTGFFISADGMIITNRHVVEDTEAEYTVVFGEDSEYSAEVLVRHPVLDIAVLKIKTDNEEHNFPVLELGESDKLEIGQAVIAIGNSLGEFSNSVSLGIVSGLQRDLVAGDFFGHSKKLNGIIQTDAAINPGNSGGPLLDTSGKVIGVNVAMATGAENVGFALPIDKIKKIIEQVKNGETFKVPFLGINYIILNESIQKENNLPYNYGALILRGEKITDFAVVPGSAADKAELRENDIILEIDGQKLTVKNDLTEIIVEYNVGDEVTLKIWRKGEEMELKIKLGERS